MLSFLIVILSVVLCVLRCLPLTGRRATLTAVGSGAVLVGGIPPVVMALCRYRRVMESALPEADWAADMLGGWLSLAGGFTAFVGIALLLAALTEHKLTWMRTLIAPCAVILLQIGAVGYAALCQDSPFPLEGTVMLFAAGCGAMLLCGVTVDSIRYALCGRPLLWAGKPQPSKPAHTHRRKKRR